ncbi:hypothetical protein [Pendulispora albinea]|uniref:Uncharacterized protein n=1 Tax=Pendulispora albinea TaxID=2741071 RepID=A0ABZ2LN27_9BACT
MMGRIYFVLAVCAAGCAPGAASGDRVLHEPSHGPSPAARPAVSSSEAARSPWPNLDEREREDLDQDRFETDPSDPSRAYEPRRDYSAVPPGLEKKVEAWVGKYAASFKLEHTRRWRASEGDTIALPTPLSTAKCYAVLLYAETWKENPLGHAVRADGSYWSWIPSWRDRREADDFPRGPEEAGKYEAMGQGIETFTAFYALSDGKRLHTKLAVRSRDRLAMLGYDAHPVCPSDEGGELLLRAEKGLSSVTPASPKGIAPWGRGFVVLLSRAR